MYDERSTPWADDLLPDGAQPGPWHEHGASGSGTRQHCTCDTPSAANEIELLDGASDPLEADLEHKPPFFDEATEVVAREHEPGRDVGDSSIGSYEPEVELGLPGDDEEAWTGSAFDEEASSFAAPRNVGAPFAPSPPRGAVFPVRSTHPRHGEVAYQSQDGRIWGTRGRRFGASRSNRRRHHAAVDLYARRGDEVVACADGTILRFYGFCCGPRKTSWALVVDHGDLVINYGEVEPDSLSTLGLSIGSHVRAGQVIARIGVNPGGSSMLHFETYAPGTTRNLRWPFGTSAPQGLWDPTRFLLTLTPVAPRSSTSHGGSDRPDRPVLRRGSRGPAVRRLQTALGSAGFATSVDGDFGRATEAAVRAFQSDRGLAVDGVVGSRTWAALLGDARGAEAAEGDGRDHVPLIDAETSSGSATTRFGLYDGLASAGVRP